MTKDETVFETDTVTDLPANVSAYVAGQALAWALAKPGIHTKTLFRSPDGRTRTLLTKLEPGARSTPHSHAELEQIYILQGSFYDGHRWLRPGDHCVRAPGVEHLAHSEEGALVLVVYSPA